MAADRDEDISLLPVGGWVMFLVGVGIMVWGWLFDTSIESGGDYGLIGDRVHNIGLVTTKLGILVSGGAILVAGVVILAAYGIRSDIRRAKQTDPAPPTA